MSDQDEAFDYLIADQNVSEDDRGWVTRMRGAFARQGFLTIAQIAVMDNIAERAGVELDGAELFAKLE